MFKPRILTTNMGALCSYGFIRCLKGESERIILIYQQDKPTVIAHSKYVDKAYQVSFPKVNWESGKGSRENNPDEEKYIQKVLKICDEELINVVIPTCDAELYLFSKNKERFEKSKIVVLVSKYESIMNTADKFKLISTAKEVNFPHPSTYLPESLEEADRMAEELGFPVIVKSRIGTGAAGVRIVHEKSQLVKAVEELKETYDWPMIQEYIPGNREPSINLIIDNDGNPVLHFSLRKLRYVAASRSTCVEIIDPLPETEKAIELVKALGLRGFVAMQTKYDKKTNTHKLIEINARWGGNAAICLSIGQKLGLNPMIMNIEALTSEKRLPLKTFRPGIVGMSMIEDLLAIRKYFNMRKKNATKRVDNPMPKLKSLLLSYWDTYTHRSRTTDYFTKAIFDDPMMAFSIYKRLIKMAFNDNGVFVPWGEINHRIAK